jgi:predicted GNAT family acetyltransferase
MHDGGVRGKIVLMDRFGSASPSTGAHVRHDIERSRYELVVDGRVVSRAEYDDGDDGGGPVRTFTHTFTDPAHRGHGHAAVVVRAALDDTRDAGRRVEPACWFVREFIDAHPGYRDLLAS